MIKRIQKLLSDAGYYSGDVDGITGPMTLDAVKSAIAAAAGKSPSQAMADWPELVSQLRRDEGTVKKNGRHIAYQDHLGYLTIGVGRLIDERRGGGISDAESDILLANDISTRVAALAHRLPWMSRLDNARQGVLVNMSFQLGVDGLLGFRNTLAMIERGDYIGAARGMLSSKWSQQTPARAKRLSEQMRTGVWQ